MSYNAFSNTSISALAKDTFRSTNHMYAFTFTGLRPLTKHKVYLEDVDYTWACKGWGQNIGEEILSDANGEAKVYILYELPFSAPSAYEIKEPNSINFASNRLSNQNKRVENQISTYYKTFEIKSADGLSHAIVQREFNIVLFNADYNRIEQHD